MNDPKKVNPRFAAVAEELAPPPPPPTKAQYAIGPPARGVNLSALPTVDVAKGAELGSIARAHGLLRRAGETDDELRARCQLLLGGEAEPSAIADASQLGTECGRRRALPSKPSDAMSEIPHPIPYQGSKRKLAPIILEYLPDDVETLFEPFCGSAAVSLAVARASKAKRIELNDSLDSLAKLWMNIVGQPTSVADDYEKIWHGQKDDPRAYYDVVRDEFNRDRDPSKLLFLLARCVKNAVRFNGSGDFNQSPDKRRTGTRPERMRQNIIGAAALLKGRSSVTSGDYAAAFSAATARDVIYMDPPYQGTSGERDQRYHQQLDRTRFVDDLDRLLVRGVRVIISFDGRCGDRTYGPELPASLGLTKLEIHAGRSSQATLNGEEADTVESLYVSPKLLRSAGVALATVARGSGGVLGWHG